MSNGLHNQNELEAQKYALDQSAIVAVTDRSGRITYVNNFFCDISGYNRDELLGQTHSIINSGFHPKEFFSDLWRTILKGEIWRGEIKNKSKSGAYYWVNTTIVPFKDADGKIYQFLSVRQDITRLKEAKEIIKDQQSKLVASSRLSALGELSAALTHEINNPLSVILGRAEMLQTALSQPTVDIETIKSMVEAIQTTGHRIEKIMKTVRSLAHGGDNEPIQKVTLKSLFDAVLDILGARIRGHGIQIQIDDKNFQKQISCRPTEVFQILTNLVNNSHDAILGKPKSWIKLSCEIVDGYYLFEVLDSGNGLSENVIDYLFTPFYTTKPIGAGTGLGLSISKTLATRAGGDIYYDKTSLNTKFVLKLPI